MRFNTQSKIFPDYNTFKESVEKWKANKETIVFTNGCFDIIHQGHIDAIWSYAELGLQEYKSSVLLIKTLEQEGFAIERGLADVPTCFVASYGSGKPVVGILAEYDALPMISQSARTPQLKKINLDI